jgi:hypothetical protein
MSQWRNRRTTNENCCGTVAAVTVAAAAAITMTAASAGNLVGTAIVLDLRQYKEICPSGDPKFEAMRDEITQLPLPDYDKQYVAQARKRFGYDPRRTLKTTRCDDRSKFIENELKAKAEREAERKAKLAEAEAEFVKATAAVEKAKAALEAALEAKRVAEIRAMTEPLFVNYNFSRKL